MERWPTGRSAEAGALSAQVTRQPLLVEACLIRIRITDLRRRRRCCHPQRQLPRSASEQWRQVAAKSRCDDQIVGRCRPEPGQRSAPARTAGKLPGGDIFLDLLSSGSTNRDPVELARQITTGGALWERARAAAGCRANERSARSFVLSAMASAGSRRAGASCVSRVCNRRRGA
jgi:hypothetical protein